MRGCVADRPFRTLFLMFFMVMLAPGSEPPIASPHPPDELVSLAKSGGKPVIADFGLGFCMQCRRQAETLERVRKAYGEKVVIRMVNAAGESSLMSRYEVELVPTLLFFDAAGNVVLKKVGPMGYDAIRDQLSRMGVR